MKHSPGFESVGVPANYANPEAFYHIETETLLATVSRRYQSEEECPHTIILIRNLKDKVYRRLLEEPETISQKSLCVRNGFSRAYFIKEEWKRSTDLLTKQQYWGGWPMDIWGIDLHDQSCQAAVRRDQLALPPDFEDGWIHGIKDILSPDVLLVTIGLHAHKASRAEYWLCRLFLSTGELDQLAHLQGIFL